jgi:hypothetical protein
MEFPLLPGRSGSHMLRIGSDPQLHNGGNKLLVSVLSGEALTVPDVGIFVAKTTVTFLITPVVVEGWHISSGLLAKIAEPITINFKNEPVRKIVVGGWFNTKPQQPLPPNPKPNSAFSHEYVEVYVHVADLDIDSDNSDGYGLDRNDAEDAMESPVPGGELTGKLLICPKNRDTNGNSVPDFADGIDRSYGDGLSPDNTSGDDATVRFPIVILFLQGFNEDVDKVVFEYSGSHPAAVTRLQNASTGDIVYSPAEGNLRLWAKDGPQTRQPTSIGETGLGDYIVPSQPYSFYNLSAARIAQGHFRFYLEGIESSEQTADQEIGVFVQLNNQTTVKVDTVRVTSASVDIVPDDGMAGVVGDMVSGFATSTFRQKHFVSPKKLWRSLPITLSSKHQEFPKKSSHACLPGCQYPVVRLFRATRCVTASEETMRSKSKCRLPSKIRTNLPRSSTCGLSGLMAKKSERARLCPLRSRVFQLLILQWMELVFDCKGDIILDLRSNHSRSFMTEAFFLIVPISMDLTHITEQ